MLTSVHENLFITLAQSQGKPFSKFLLHGTEVKPESFIQENGYFRYLWHKSMNSWHEFLPLNII